MSYGITTISAYSPPTEKVIRLKLIGNPIPWAAPRVGQRATYDIRSEVKKSGKWQVKMEYRGEPIDSPTYLIVTFYMPIPSSTPKKHLAAMLDGTIKHTKKPDVDNLFKLLCDLLKGIVIKDDNQVYKICCEKKYSHEPRTEIEVWY